MQHLRQGPTPYFADFLSGSHVSQSKQIAVPDVDARIEDLSAADNTRRRGGSTAWSDSLARPAQCF